MGVCQTAPEVVQDATPYALKFAQTQEEVAENGGYVYCPFRPGSQPITILNMSYDNKFVWFNGKHIAVPRKTRL